MDALTGWVLTWWDTALLWGWGIVVTAAVLGYLTPWRGVAPIGSRHDGLRALSWAVVGLIAAWGWLDPPSF